MKSSITEHESSETLMTSPFSSCSIVDSSGLLWTWTEKNRNILRFDIVDICWQMEKLKSFYPVNTNLLPQWSSAPHCQWSSCRWETCRCVPLQISLPPYQGTRSLLDTGHYPVCPVQSNPAVRVSDHRTQWTWTPGERRSHMTAFQEGFIIPDHHQNTFVKAHITLY